MTPEEIRAAGWQLHTPGDPCPVAAVGRPVELLLLNGKIVSRLRWGGGATESENMLGWRYADPADAQRVIAAKDAEIARLREGLAVSEAKRAGMQDAIDNFTGGSNGETVA